MVIIVIALISLVLTGPFIVNYRTGIKSYTCMACEREEENCGN